MTRDLHPRWWRFAAALLLLFALALLLVPQVQHDHASLLLVALAPVLPVPGGSITSTFSDINKNPITTAHPAIANTKVYSSALGLGPTNPVVPPNTNTTDKAPTTMPVTVMAWPNCLDPWPPRCRRGRFCIPRTI